MNSKSSQTENAIVSVSTQTVMTCFQNVEKITQTMEKHSDNEDVFFPNHSRKRCYYSKIDESFCIADDESSSDKEEPKEENLNVNQTEVHLSFTI